MQREHAAFKHTTAPRLLMRFRILVLIIPRCRIQAEAAVAADLGSIFPPTLSGVRLSISRAGGIASVTDRTVNLCGARF
jgi:hypothetical protein